MRPGPRAGRVPQKPEASGRIAITPLQRRCHLVLSRYAYRSFLYLIVVRVAEESNQNGQMDTTDPCPHSGPNGYARPSQVTVHPPNPLARTKPGPAFGRFHLHRTGGILGKDLRPGMNGCWEARGLWDPQLRVKPITFLELRAVTDSIQAFEEHLKRVTHLRIWKDNQAVLQILNAMVSRSRALMQELRVLHRLLSKLRISIESQYLPSAVNRLADRLSQLHTLDDWWINQKSIAPLLSSLPTTIDRFADNQNKLCPRFNSEFASPSSLGIDALSQDWKSETNFWNPPLKLIPLAVYKLIK